MNKRLFVLICSIILFQYIYNTDSDCTKELKEGSTHNCADLGTSATNKKCIEETVAEATNKCKEDDILCSEKNSGNLNDDFCRTLTITGADSEKLLCIKGETGCKSETKCDEATGDDDAACNKFPVVTKGNICKKDTTKDSTKCKEVKGESTKNGANNLRISLVFLISLILF